MATELHEQRLDTVLHHALSTGARTVLDLGCGEGEMLLRLAREAPVQRIVGLDISTEALAHARQALAFAEEGQRTRVELRNGSFTEPDAALAGFDLALLVETIEHVDPGLLSRLERAVFGGYRAHHVLVTTPNQEYNVLHGMAPGTMRHPDHRFEWTRARFRQWTRGIAGRNAYRVQFVDVGEADPLHGASTQMARFERLPPAA